MVASNVHGSYTYLGVPWANARISPRSDFFRQPTFVEKTYTRKSPILRSRPFVFYMNCAFSKTLNSGETFNSSFFFTFVYKSLARALGPSKTANFPANEHESSETSPDLFCAPWVGVSIYANPSFQLAHTAENELYQSRIYFRAPLVQKGRNRT